MPTDSPPPGSLIGVTVTASDVSVNFTGVKSTGYGILLGGTRQDEPMDEGAPTFFWLVCTDGRTILGEQNPFCGTIEEMFDVALSLAPGQYYEVEETEEVGVRLSIAEPEVTGTLPI